MADVRICTLSKAIIDNIAADCGFVSKKTMKTIVKGGEFMNRIDFLENPDVAGFVGWLVAELPNIPVHLNFKSSKFVPCGINQHCVGVDSVLNQYCWTTNWSATKTSLTHLRTGLRNAIITGNHSQAENYCLLILKWGGVTGAKGFIQSQTRYRTLIGYLQNMENLLILTGPNTLGGLTPYTVHHYDSGMTKIHALLDSTGSPIYDSRVGAAIAMLYAMHCHQNGKNHSPLLSFPVGSARGKQIRNPGNLGLGYPMSPSFYTRSVPKHFWAQSQLKLGWILSEVLSKSSLFPNEGSIADRCHALEATLFMLGYDLQCFLPCGCVLLSSR